MAKKTKYPIRRTQSYSPLLFILILLFCSLIAQVYGQTIYTSFPSIPDSQFVQIDIKNSSQASSRAVSKSYVGQPSGLHVENNVLILSGDGEFHISDDKIVLHYDRYDYYLLPFYPDYPAYRLNSYYRNTCDTAYLYLNGEHQLNPSEAEYGHLLYGEFNKAEDNRHHPISVTLEQNNGYIICQFMSENDLSGDYMFSLKPGVEMPGGGVLFQYEKGKPFYHDLQKVAR